MNKKETLFTNEENSKRRFSLVLIALYKGVVYKEQDEDLWRDLLGQRGAVLDHFAQLGLSVVIDEGEGYAFATYPEPAGGEEEDALPRLAAKRQLPFIVSLTLAMLRKRMAEFDTAGDGTRLIITRDEIIEIMSPYMPESTNEVKLADKIDTAIGKVKELGFLRAMKNKEETYEVMRILKAYIDAKWLNEFDAKLQAYKAYAAGGKAE